jgi:integrase
MSLTLVPPRADRSPNYRVRGTVKVGKKSKYVEESTGFADAKLADQYRIKREGEIVQELLYGVRASHRFADVAVEYIEIVKPQGPQLDAIIGRSRRDGTVSPNLIDDLRDKPVEMIDQTDADAIIRKRFQHHKPGTILRHLYTPLVAVLTFGAKRKYCDRPVFDRPKYQDKRDRWASYEDADRLLLAAVSDHAFTAKNIRVWQETYLRTLLLFLMLSGCRISEALLLDWTDVDLGARWLVFRNTKRGKRGADQPGEDRGVPIHHQLVIALANLPVASDGPNRGPRRQGRVFVAPTGKPYADREAYGGGARLKRAWDGVCRRAGITGLHIHDLRHTCATWLLMAGVQAEVRDEILGHGSSETGRRYAHVPRPLPMAAIEKLPERQMVPLAAPQPSDQRVRARVRAKSR